METLDFLLCILQHFTPCLKFKSLLLRQLVASGISLATSFFIALQSSSRAHSAAPRFQTEPASLGFDLGPPLRGGFFLSQENIDFNRPFQLAASDKTLAASFFLAACVRKSSEWNHGLWDENNVEKQRSLRFKQHWN